MSKAILVIDMPNSCKECPLFHDHYSDMCCGGLNKRGIDYPYPKDFRQDWCPLKKFPEKFELRKEDKNIELRPDAKIPNSTGWIGFDVGWNRCLDEILGE